MTVDLFITCLNDALFPQTGKAVVRVLERLGHTVRFNPNQVCCGQMHFNSGYQHEAIPLIKNLVSAFEEADVVVAPSGSCVAMVREMYSRAAQWTGHAELIESSARLSNKIFEFSEFLVNQLGLVDVGAYFPHRVTYHPTCHSLRLLQVGDAPLRLLQAVEGLELRNLADADQCCGFGGTFAVKNPETSTAMLQDKMKRVDETGAEFCTAGDNSCLMHIGGGMSREKGKARTIHIAEILASTREAPFS